MTWPNYIYVATTEGGVYYTNNFVSPSIQPTWIGINTGLGSLQCGEFHLDPFHQADRQYVMTSLAGADNKLYRREYGGAWTAILTRSDCAALLGTSYSNIIYGFYPDPSIDGKIWVLVKGNYSQYDPAAFAIYSTNYGSTWNTVTTIFRVLQFYALGSIRAYGNNVFVRSSNNTGAYYRVYYSSNGGSSWSNTIVGNPAVSPFNPLIPNRVYLPASGLAQFTIGVGVQTLQGSLSTVRYDDMWFDPVDSLHQRLFYNNGVDGNRLYHTHDGWSTKSDGGVLDKTPIALAPWAGDDTDNILIGMHANINQPHIIGALYGEADITISGIGGSSCGVPPYVNSIPYTCDIVATSGIGAIEIPPGNVYTNAVAMPGYSDVGSSRGVPMAGDRSAWDSLNYPLRHTNDIDAGIHWTDDGVIGLIGHRILISELTPTGTTASFTGIPTTYEHLEVEYVCRSTKSATYDQMKVYLNNDTTDGNYRSSRDFSYASGTVGGDGGNNSLVDDPSATNSPTSSVSRGTVSILYYKETTFKKQITAIANSRRDDSSVYEINFRSGVEWESTSAVNRVDLILLSGNFATGSTFRLYGIY